MAQLFDATRATLEAEPIPVAQALGIDDGTFRSAFSVSAAGTLAHRAGTVARRQLVWVDRTGKVLNTVGPPDENVLAHPALAPNEQRVAVNRIVQGNFDVWLMDLGRGVASRFTFDPAVDFTSVWSPDGSRLVFSSIRKGVSDLFEKSASGGADEQPLLLNMQDKWPLDWSRDGRFVLYEILNDLRTASDLWVLPLMGERKPFPLVQASFDEIAGQFSPDGRWLADGTLMAVDITADPKIDSGIPRELFDTGLTLNPVRDQYRVTPDGQRFLLLKPVTEAAPTPITVASTGRRG